MAIEKRHGCSTKGVETRALGQGRANMTEKETLVSAAAALVNFSQVISLGDHGDPFQALPKRMRSDPALCQCCQSRDQPSGVAGVH